MCVRERGTGQRASILEFQQLNGNGTTNWKRNGRITGDPETRHVLHLWVQVSPLPFLFTIRCSQKRRYDMKRQRVGFYTHLTRVHDQRKHTIWDTRDARRRGATVVRCGHFIIGAWVQSTSPALGRSYGNREGLGSRVYVKGSNARERKLEENKKEKKKHLTTSPRYRWEPRHKFVSLTSMLLFFL